MGSLAVSPVHAIDQTPMTEEEAAKLGEEFGVVVGEVDEEIQKELKLQRPQGVAVFEVIGNSRADYAGIKVRSVIKEIDKTEIKNMLEFGRAIKKAMRECNFTVGTYEPADPGDPVGWGVNFTSWVARETRKVGPCESDIGSSPRDSCSWRSA